MHRDERPVGLLVVLVIGLALLVPPLESHADSASRRCGLVDGVADGSSDFDRDGDGISDCLDERPLIPGNPAAGAGDCVHTVANFGEGFGGLRWMLTVANESETCTLNLLPGTYSVTLSTLIVGNGTSIVGAGADDTLIDFDGTGAAISVQWISGNSDTVMLSGLTLEYDNEGLRHELYDGDVILNNVVVRGDPDGWTGSAVIAESQEFDGKYLYLNNSIIRESGGLLVSAGSTAVGNDCLITENPGRAVTVREGGYSHGVGEFTDCEISFNTGGGFFVGGAPGPSVGEAATLTLVRSVVKGNTADEGAGIFVEDGAYRPGGWASITDSTIEDNVAGVAGGGIFLEDGHHDGSGPGRLFLIGSTLARNAAPSGGGIYRERYPPTVGYSATSMENCTLSGNTASGSGGAIYSEGGWPSIGSCTITLNVATTGGGIYVEAGLPTLDNTILGENSASESGANCYGSLDSEGGYNLVGELNGCDFLAEATDLLETTPGLGPLAANGGPTDTHLPEVSSEAVDAGPVSGEDCVPTDQRGVSRPQGIACDIGSVERAPDDSEGVPPIADGSAETDPVTVQKVQDEVRIAWGEQCDTGATSMVVWGPLADVADYAISSVICGIPPGEFSAPIPWEQIPGDVWLLVLRHDGDLESSWGASTSGERNGSAPSGECGTSAKDMSSTCP